MSAAAPEPRLGLRGRIGRQLGADLLENIFARLNAKQLAAAELTCRHWYTAGALPLTFSAGACSMNQGQCPWQGGNVSA